MGPKRPLGDLRVTYRRRQHPVDNRTRRGAGRSPTTAGRSPTAAAVGRPRLATMAPACRDRRSGYGRRRVVGGPGARKL